MKPPVVVAALLTWLTPAAELAAQPAPKRTLQTLVRDHQQRLSKAGSRDLFTKAVTRHAQDLEEYLAHEAKGAERFDGRFLLVNTYLLLRKRDEAKTALAALDEKSAPALTLLNGAAWAERLQMTKTRGRWIDAALGRPGSFKERMEVATFLMTQLVEVKRGEKVFDDAYKRAKDDDARARVLWHRSLAIREREDLPEGAYEQELSVLAKKFPKTRWGGIARDRLRAFDFKPGVAPNDFKLRSLDGKPHSVEGYRGKVHLLYFWALTKSLPKLKLTWPQVFGGDGFESDIALRYRVERVPYLLLIGKDSRIAAMNLHPIDDYGTEVMRAAVQKAVDK